MNKILNTKSLQLELVKINNRRRYVSCHRIIVSSKKSYKPNRIRFDNFIKEGMKKNKTKEKLIYLHKLLL